MIRRGFWLTAGAVTGIYGYRRVSALGRRLSASLNPAGPAQEARTTGTAHSTGSAQSTGSTPGTNGTRGGHRGVLSLARGTYRFTRDVREGMDLYMARHSEPPGPTLSTDRGTHYEPEDGH